MPYTVAGGIMRMLMSVFVVCIAALIFLQEAGALYRFAENQYRASIAQDDAYRAHIADLDRNVRMVYAGY